MIWHGTTTSRAVPQAAPAQKEIAELASRAIERGYTIVPLHVYLVRGRAKIEIAPGRGRRQYDKRHVLAEKESRREVERALRERQRE